MVFKVFLLSRFRLVFFLTTLVSHPPGVMLLNCSNTPRNSTTNIEKTSRKGGALERERPNRSVVKIDEIIKKFLRKFLLNCNKLYEQLMNNLINIIIKISKKFFENFWGRCGNLKKDLGKIFRRIVNKF